MDLISRQAAIDRIRGTGYADQIKENIIMILMCLPSAQPYTDDEIQKMQDIEQAMLEKAYECGKQDAAQWIPCSERLPEVGRSVLLSVGGMYTAEGCLREDGDWTQFRWDAIQRKDMVGAWMPLPEPWEGESNERA